MTLAVRSEAHDVLADWIETEVHNHRNSNRIGASHGQSHSFQIVEFSPSELQRQEFRTHQAARVHAARKHMQSQHRARRHGKLA